jgi:hypothetical protein
MPWVDIVDSAWLSVAFRDTRSCSGPIALSD